MAKSNVNSEKKSGYIYMDYASATPLDRQVASVMSTSFRKDFSNSSAIHEGGVKAKKKLEEARKKIAYILEVHKDEIIFTSGATESNNLGIFGSVKDHRFSHIVTTNIEHASVLEACKYLEHTRQAEVTYVPVEASGIVDPKKISKALKKNTVLVSVMYANNEIGTVQPIREIAKAIRHYNKKNSGKILFHSDITQAINYLPINAQRLGVDMASFNSSKIYGPKGVGVFFRRRGLKISPIMYGGNQESSLRPGTENVPLVLGLTEALEITEKIKEKESNRLLKLQKYFFQKIEKKGLIVNGDKNERLPNNLNITIPKIPSDLLVIELSARGIMASAKSACKSGDGKASHVISAINKDLSEEDGSLRFSLGRQTTKNEIDIVIKSLFEILAKLKKWYN